MMKLQDTLKVANTGAAMPRLGFGVYQLHGASCVQACQRALEAGYRHFDSAQFYRNEAEVGQAIRESTSVRREDVFLTTKILSGPMGASAEALYQNVAGSVDKMGGEGGYVDLFLIHSPGSRSFRESTWKALEKLHKEGRAKTIGVSNYPIDCIEEMKEYATVWPPHANQIELHPWSQQRDLVKYCHDNGIIVQAYSPLVVGAKLRDPTLGSVAEKHSKSPAQVLIRYALQKNWVPLPKSGNPARIVENTKVYDFELDKNDMASLDSLER